MPKRNNYVRFDVCYLCKITQQNFGISKRSSPKTNRGARKSLIQERRIYGKTGKTQRIFFPVTEIGSYT